LFFALLLHAVFCGTLRNRDCGEMHAASQEFDTAPVCQTGDSIIYAWAMDAPELHLPSGVGFKVGGDTDIQWLVLQVHYKDVSSFLPPSESRDREVA